MGVGIPSHMCSEVDVAFSRPPELGLSGWKTAAPTPVVYWQGKGYVTLALKSKVDITKGTGTEGAILTGVVLFYLDPPPEGGLLPKATDFLLIDGAEAECLSIRPPNSLIDYWKAEVRTGVQ